MYLYICCASTHGSAVKKFDHLFMNWVHVTSFHFVPAALRLWGIDFLKIDTIGPYDGYTHVWPVQPVIWIMHAASQGKRSCVSSRRLSGSPATHLLPPRDASPRHRTSALQLNLIYGPAFDYGRVLTCTLIPVGAYQCHQRWHPQTPIWGGSIS